MNNQIFKIYSHQGLCRAVDVFNFPNDYPTLTRILSYRYLFQYNNKDKRIAPNNNKIIESIKKVVKNNNRENASNLMELVDILLEFSKKDGDELLAYLRQTQLQAKIVPPNTNGPKGTIYADSQSVHNGAITNTIKQVAKYLCTNFCPSLSNGEKEVLKESIKTKLEQNIIFIGNKDILEEVLNRIYNDNAIFEGYNTDVILFSLWNWVLKQGNDELYHRISEELFEMHKYCSTRILSGLINSIQGFTDDKNLIIKMSVEEQCKSVIYSYLDKALKECKDEKVVDGMLEKDKYFLDFVVETVNNKRSEWKKEYGDDFEVHINKHSNNYTQSLIFELKN